MRPPPLSVAPHHRRPWRPLGWRLAPLFALALLTPFQRPLPIVLPLRGYPPGIGWVSSGLLLVVVLFVLFRNRYSVFLPLGAVGLAVSMTVGYMVLAGDSFDIINAIVPTLLLVIGIGDAVHFLTTYYQELGAGEDKREAVHRMVRRIGAARHHSRHG